MTRSPVAMRLGPVLMMDVAPATQMLTPSFWLALAASMAVSGTPTNATSARSAIRSSCCPARAALRRR